MAGEVGSGRVRFGLAGFGMAGVVWHVFSRLGAVRCGTAWQARHGTVWTGKAR